MSKANFAVMEPSPILGLNGFLLTVTVIFLSGISITWVAYCVIRLVVILIKLDDCVVIRPTCL